MKYRKNVKMKKKTANQSTEKNKTHNKTDRKTAIRTKHKTVSAAISSRFVSVFRITLLRLPTRCEFPPKTARALPPCATRYLLAYQPGYVFNPASVQYACARFFFVFDPLPFVVTIFLCKIAKPICSHNKNTQSTDQASDLIVVVRFHVTCACQTSNACFSSP